MLNREQVEQRQEQLREQIALLPQEQRKHFYQRWQKQVKDPDSYAVLNYLLLAGLHHFYLGKWLRGAVNLLISILAILLVALGAGLLEQAQARRQQCFRNTGCDNSEVGVLLLGNLDKGVHDADHGPKKPDKGCR